jgi:hypothetical protein
MIRFVRKWDDGKMKADLLIFPVEAGFDIGAVRRSARNSLARPGNALKRRCTALMILAFLLACLATPTLTRGETANRIAEDPTIRGKGQDGACMDYAVAVASKLEANGIHGRLIFYHWRIRNTNISGSHVFVAYHLEDGSEWIVDNEIAEPKKVPADATLMQLVFLLSGDPSAPVDVELENGMNELSIF